MREKQVRVSERLLWLAKAAAIRQKKSVNEWIEAAIVAALGKSKKEAK